MDSIEEVLRKFKLSEEERDGVCLEEEEMAQGVRECELSLIGKVWGDKLANIGGIRSFVGVMWPQVRNLRVVEIGRNLFQFLFEKEKDMDLVLNKRPWIYDGQPLILLRWRAGLEEEGEALSKTLIWIQLWNIPIHWITKEVGRKVGSIFARVEDVIIPQGGGKDDKHLKILAEIDLTVPLPRGIMVKSNGMVKWIEFKYEKCPDFCFCCGRVGHNERSCGRKGLDKEREPQYGNWLRASYPRSPNRKSRNGNDHREDVREESQFQPKRERIGLRIISCC